MSTRLASRTLVLASLALLAACSEYELGVTGDDLGLPLDCDLDTIYPDDVVPIEQCPQQEGTFVPLVEWGAGEGKSSRSVPAVADLDGDGMPEVIANFTGGLLPGGTGRLVVLESNGTQR